MSSLDRAISTAAGALSVQARWPERETVAEMPCPSS